MIIVHCSDTPNGRQHTAADIHRWHQERGFDGIGYHYVIQLDGLVEKGRPDYWKGAHCRGYNDEIGVCLIGRDEFTLAQETSLKWLLDSFKGQDVGGHYEVDRYKTCPNFDVAAWRAGSLAWPTFTREDELL